MWTRERSAVRSIAWLDRLCVHVHVHAGFRRVGEIAFGAGHLGDGAGRRVGTRRPQIRIIRSY